MDGDQDAPAAAAAGPPVPVVLAALAEAEAAVACWGVAVREPAWALGDGQCRDAVGGADRLLAAAQAAFLGLVGDLDSRPEAVAGAPAGFVARTFLAGACRRSPAQAGRDVKAARALALNPAVDAAAGAGAAAVGHGVVAMPCMTAALSEGVVSREHVDLAVRALHALPKALLRRVDPDGAGVAAKADAYLAENRRPGRH